MGIGDNEKKIFIKPTITTKKILVGDIAPQKTTTDPFEFNRHSPVERLLRQGTPAPLVRVTNAETVHPKPEPQRDPDAVTLEQLADRLNPDSKTAPDFHSSAKILDTKTDWRMVEGERRSTLPPIDRLKKLRDRLTQEIDEIKDKERDPSYGSLLGALHGVEDAIAEARGGNGGPELPDPNEFVRRARAEYPQELPPDTSTISMRKGRLGAIATAALSAVGLGGLFGGWKARKTWEDIESDAQGRDQEKQTRSKDETMRKKWEKETEYQATHTLGIDKEPIVSNDGVSVLPVKHDPDITFEKIAIDGYTYPLESGRTIRLPKPGSSAKFNPSVLGADNRTAIELDDRELPDRTIEPVFHIIAGRKDIERTFPKDPKLGFEPDVFLFEWNDKKGYLVKITPLPPDRNNRTAYTISIVEAKRDE